jgi:hypothetical protein
MAVSVSDILALLADLEEVNPLECTDVPVDDGAARKLVALLKTYPNL